MKTNNKSFALIILSIALVIITSCAGLSYAKHVKTANAPSESASVAKFGVTLTWDEGGLFSNSYTTSGGIKSVQMSDSAKGLAPGTSGSTSLVVGGTSEVSVKIKIGVQAEYEGWKVQDETSYMPIVFTIKNGENYLQDSGEFASTKHTFTMDEMTNLNIDLETIIAGTSLARTYTIGWEWAANTAVDAETYYVCTQADDIYTIGDVIGAETYLYLSEEQLEKFEEVTTSDVIDTYISGLPEAPTLAMSLVATAEQVI